MVFGSLFCFLTHGVTVFNSGLTAKPKLLLVRSLRAARYRRTGTIQLKPKYRND